MEEEFFQIKSTSLRWESVTDWHLTWKEMWSMDQRNLASCCILLLIYNPHQWIWELEGKTTFALCDAEGCNLKHGLSSCRSALADGWFRWWHDKVLKEVVKWIDLHQMQVNKEKGQLKDHLGFYLEPMTGSSMWTFKESWCSRKI